jgi:ferredoxin-NADP reductase
MRSSRPYVLRGHPRSSVFICGSKFFADWLAAKVRALGNPQARIFSRR